MYKLEEWYYGQTKGQLIFIYAVSIACILFYCIGLIPLALLIYLHLGRE